MEGVFVRGQPLRRRQLSGAPPLVAALALVLVLAGCGSAGHGSPAVTDASAMGALPQGHPQAIEPTAGAHAAASAGGAEIVGDVNAHAPTLAQVRKELTQLNLCGGALSSADAAPVIQASGPGFVADPGTIQSVGQLPVLTARLDELAKALGVVIYGISGYRTPAHSVAVGGFADDPHTQGEAEDIGVNGLLRSSAAQISEPQLAQYGLYRPFDPSGNGDNTEVNHIQLIPSSGPLSVAESTATFDPDPGCR
jgi:peptidase M15-like protein